MIDLNKFNKPKKIIVPILNHSFRYNGKRYNNVLVDNGWYEVIIAGNNCKVISNIVIFQVIDAKTITGYVYEDNIIFSNFDVGKRKINQEVMTKVYFNTSPEFTSIEAVIWEDGLLYYIQPNYNDYKIFEVKSALDYNGNISNIKGITPELKTLTLFVDLRQQKIEELKRIKDQQELAKTIQGRLYLSFQMKDMDDQLEEFRDQTLAGAFTKYDNASQKWDDIRKELTALNLRKLRKLVNELIPN